MVCDIQGKIMKAESWFAYMNANPRDRIKDQVRCISVALAFCWGCDFVHWYADKRLMTSSPGKKPMNYIFATFRGVNTATIADFISP